MKTQTVDGFAFYRMVKLAASHLGANRKLVNDLNVFPIPDGDTGDNMYMTIRSGCDSAAGSLSDNLSNTASSVSSGMLFGARGNSGVILSRIFAGLARGLEGADTADIGTFKEAMKCAVEDAYGAVAEPVEGTMLTVLREAVAAAASAADYEEYADFLCREADASLERTPRLLDVLARAGVVDSGGAGLVNIFDGFKAFFEGEADVEVESVGNTASHIDVSAFTEDSVLEFGYCTEFLLRLQNSKVDVNSFDESVIREYLESAGNSLVFFRDGSIIKVHVHTMTPGDILNTCQKWGEYLSVKIENMTLQHHENHMEEKVAKQGPKRPCAIVTVASGEGVCNLLSDMGAEVIAGGQTMNPSTEDFIRAFDKVNANRIFVLPNNSNIILTASQAAEIYTDSEVLVIPSRTIGEGYCVLGSVDFASGTAAEVLEAAEAVLSESVTGMVSKSVRDAEGVREGEYIGFTGKEKILSSSAVRNEAALELCDKLGASDYDVILLIKGADVASDEADKLYETLQAKCRRTEIVAVDGKHPVLDYIFVFE